MNKRRIKPLILFVFALAMAGPLNAAEYFVNKHGSDANDGSSREKAFLTVHQGLNAIAPGDTLTIGPGEYFESASRTNLGDRSTTTIIRAEIRGAAILRGDIPMPPHCPVEGRKHVYCFKTTNEVQCINEVDTLNMYNLKPSLSEIEFAPGSYYFDEKAGVFYFTT